MAHGKKTAYAEAVKQRIVQTLPEKDRYGLWHGRSYPHICKELRDNFIDGMGALKGKLSGKTIKFHEGATHLNSSQMLCINFFNKFFENAQSEALLLQILRDMGLGISDGEKIKDATPEYEPDPKERTNFDFFLQLTSGRHISFEVKYTESEFGGISFDRKNPNKYTEKWEYIYLPMVQKSPYLGERCQENLFYKHYQIHRNIAYARAEDIVVFLTPRNNHTLDEERRYIDEFCTPNIRNLYWEDMVSVVLEKVQSDPGTYDYFCKFRDKYFPEDLEALVMEKEANRSRFKDRIRKAYSEEQAAQILQVLDNRTVLKLANRAMSWLSWYEAYTLQYARCWTQKYSCPDALHPDRTEIPYEKDYLEQVRRAIRKNESLPLDVLLVAEPIAIVGKSGYTDREALFIDLMSRGLHYDIAYLLTQRIRKGQTLRKEEEAVIRDMLPSDSAEILLNTRYIPPRSDAAKRMLTCVDLL